MRCAMAKGWIIEVQFMETDGRSLQRYDVAISDPDEAIAAVWRRIGSSEVAGIRAVEELFDATFYGLGLIPGEVLPRMRVRR